MLDGNDVIHPEQISPLKNFSGGGRGQICNDGYTLKNSKNVDFDCIMKAFFDERNNRQLKVAPVRNLKNVKKFEENTDQVNSARESCKYFETELCCFR